MSDRDDILARRARYVALALAGIAAGACEDPEPQVCLTVATAPTDTVTPSTTASSTSSAPEVCLSVSPDETTTTSSTTSSSAAVRPQPPPPRVCLSQPWPKHKCLTPLKKPREGEF